MQALAVVAVALAMSLTDPAAAADTPGHDAAQTHQNTQKKAGSRAAADKPFGREGDPRKVNRVITIDMSDTMRFFPSEIRVKRGDTIRFVLRNSGEHPHEVVLGTVDDLKKQALARKNVERARGEAHAAHIESGANGHIVWQFTRPGEFHYACLIPGNFEAGMMGTIVVR